MKISIDQAITATGLVAFSKDKKFLDAITIKPLPNLSGHPKRMSAANQTIDWMEMLELLYPHDLVTHICLEEFEKHIQTGRQGAMMALHGYTGYLRGRLEAWAYGRKVAIITIGKGTSSKEQAQAVAKGMGFRDGDEHQCDAFYQGVLCGWR